MDGGSPDNRPFLRIGQVGFTTRDEFDLGLGELDENGEIDVPLVEKEQAPGFQNRPQNFRPKTLVMDLGVPFVPNLLWQTAAQVQQRRNAYQ